MFILRSAVLFAAAATVHSVGPVSFEPKPRTVLTGRDPQLAVRASGAISLMKVESGNLLLQTSFDGTDSFEAPVRINDVDGEVVSHGENSPQMSVRTRSEFYALWQARRPGQGDASALRFARSTRDLKAGLWKRPARSGFGCTRRPSVGLLAVGPAGAGDARSTLDDDSP